MKPKRVRIFAIACAAVFWIAAVGNVAASTRIPAEPTIISGYRDGPVSVPEGATPQMVKLSLSPGIWLAWAKLYVDAGPYSSSGVHCALGTISLSTGWAGHQVDVTLGGKAVMQTVSLTTSVKFGSYGGYLSLGCSRSSWAAVSANWIKITAVKVGTLTKVNLRTGATSTIGSGSPVAVIGSADASLPLSPTAATTIGRLRLAPGTWWVRTSVQHLVNNVSAASCSLSVSGARRDNDFITPFAFKQIAVMDGVGWSDYAQAAVAKCVTKSYQNVTPDQAVSNVRIAALKLGTVLAIDGYGNKTTHGSGVPFALYKTSLRFLATSAHTYTLASLVVSPGHWGLFSKADVVGGAVECQILTGFDYDRTSAWFEGDVISEVVRHAPSSEWINFQCQPWTATDQSAVSFDGIHVLALRAGSLTNVAL
jgi:hypothetical protein